MKTILKLGLLVLSILLFSSSAYARCSKSEVMKLIDKGFSKIEINSICGIAQKTSRLKRKVDKWITPENSTCRSKGGKLYRDVCEANWEDAINICYAAGGRLPNINELKKVITDCGGIVGTRCKNAVDINKENLNDSSYQACYIGKGFSSSYYYWSSTTYAGYIGNGDEAAYINFYNGDQSDSYKGQSYYVRCIRAGQ